MSFTPFTDSSSPIQGATALGFEKTWRPSRRWNLNLDNNNVANQIQQVKTATVISPAGNNQGQAKPVQNLRVTRLQINSTQYRVSVSFTPDQSDKSFQGVKVFFAQGGDSPLQVATGSLSPVTFTVSKSSSTAAVSVQSQGSLGSNALNSDPSLSIALR